MAGSMRYLFIVSCIIFILPAACMQEQQVPAKKMHLRIGYNPWPGYFPLVVALEKGFFKRHGLEVELVLRQDSLQEMAEFAAGVYDGACLALGSVITISSRTRDIKIILITDRSDGADGIVAIPEIKSPAQLTGKRVGMQIGGFGELFVLSMLEFAGLTEKDIIMIRADGSQIPELLRTGDIDAGQTWQPFIAQSAKAGARIIYTSKGTDLILDVIAFHHRVITDKPEAVRAFAKAWFEAVDYCLREPDQACKIIAASLNVPADECSFEGMKLFTREDNRRSFAAPGGFESIRAVGEVYTAFFLRIGNADTRIDMAKLLDPLFL